MPDFSEYCSEIRNPPAYKCNFGLAATVTDCQREVQAYLDDWYKDFNLLFTLTRPPSGDYYIIVITSGWPACAQEAADRTAGVAANEGGIAPFNLTCVDNVNQTAIAIQCGTNAHDCATIIAHEHGHLAGLVHTTGGEDVMHASVQASADGFRDDSLSTVVDGANNCAAAKQNSYRQMLDILGPWPGGTKPSILSSLGDGGVTDGSSLGEAADVPDARTTGGVIGPGQGSIDGNLSVAGGFDAYARTPPVVPDAAATVPAPKGGGCNLSRASGTSSPALPAGLLVAFWLSLRRTRLSRTSTGARRAATRRP